MFPVASGIVTLLTGLLVLAGMRASYSDADQCLLSYRNGPPVYLPLMTDNSTQYRLYLFRESDRVDQLGGTPILFIPGNAGSYKQGLAFGSLSAQFPELDWFLLDFNEDLSVIHGRTMLNEALFVNEAIAHILKMYAAVPESAREWKQKPESVILVGHSMGGIVARTVTTLDNYLEKSVNTIFTFSTPHAQPPLTFDLDITQLYDRIGEWWRSDKATDFELISIAGGHMDLLIPPGLTFADSFGGLSVLSYEIPNVHIPINHLAIVWCVQLREVFINALFSISDVSVPERTLPDRRQILERAFRAPWPPTPDEETVLGAKMLYGLSERVHVQGNKPLSVVLPAKSSLISYSVHASGPVHLTQSTPLEFRDYGVVKDAVLMWSSASPYVPFHKPGPPQLVLTASSETDVVLRISVDWKTTFANFAMYYRTIGACWPFAVILAAYLLSGSIRTKENGYSSYSLLGGIAGYWFVPISVCLSVLHVFCTKEWFRKLLRPVLIPNDKTVLSMLEYRNFDDNDILLGVMDPHLFWVPVVVFAVSCWIAAALLAAVWLLVYLKSFLFRGDLLPRRWFDYHSLSERVMRWGFFLAFVYIVPFQAATVFFTLVALLRLRGAHDSRIPFILIMLCASLVDAPVVIVWLRTLSPSWLLSFAGFKNALYSLPFGLFAFAAEKRRERGYLLSLLMVVIAAFTIVYSGLHCYMIHFTTQVIFGFLMIQTEYFGQE